VSAQAGQGCHPIAANLEPGKEDGMSCFTLEDTVEFFNLVLQLKLSGQEKQDLVAFMRVL
jgi:hypothetical protein